MLIHCILFLHKVKYPWFRNLWKPETLGFSAERVHPFTLVTYSLIINKLTKSPDNERIFAWHILPVDKQTSGNKNEHLTMLQNDKSAKVIIYCMLVFIFH